MCVENYWAQFISDFMGTEVLGTCLSYAEVYSLFNSCAYAAGNRDNIPSEDEFWNLAAEHSYVRMCEQCDWWVELWELNENNHCEDCWKDS